MSKERRISEIDWFSNCSAASVEEIKKLFNFLLAVKLSVIEGAIKLLVIYIEYKEKIKRNNKKQENNVLMWSFDWFSVHFLGIFNTLCLLLIASDWRIFDVFWEWIFGAKEFDFEWNSGWKGILIEIWGCIFCKWGSNSIWEKLKRASDWGLSALEIWSL